MIVSRIFLDTWTRMHPFYAHTLNSRSKWQIHVFHEIRVQVWIICKKSPSTFKQRCFNSVQLRRMMVSWFTWNSCCASFTVLEVFTDNIMPTITCNSFSCKFNCMIWEYLCFKRWYGNLNDHPEQCRQSLTSDRIN